MIALIILLIVVIVILLRGDVVAPPKDGKKWTVYGTMGCGWTRKQLEYMNKKRYLIRLSIVIKIMCWY